MKRTLFAIAALLGFALVAAGACAVDSPNFGEDNKWPCETDEDCTQPGQTCETHPDKPDQQVCTTEVTCTDTDGDGYGAPANAEDEGGSGFSKCAACPNEPKGCEPDCDDNNSNIHPGAAERCNNADNDCDGQSDNMGCTPVENDGEGCPFAFKEYETPQEETSWACENVEGSYECVLVGSFSADDACAMKRQNDGEQSTWGICGEETSGQWSQVPEECKPQ